MKSMVCFEHIGIIHSQFQNLENMPIQPTGDKASEGSIEIYPEFVEGIRDLDGFSHLILIYNFHKSNTVRLTVKPFLDDEVHGVFATRAPVRPNHIGISIVQVDKIQDNFIYVKNIDVLNDTPLLDIKPLIPDFDIPKDHIKTGWLKKASNNVKTKVSDDRFK